MTPPSGYGPSSGIPGGDDPHIDPPPPAPDRPSPAPEPEPAPARRSRPLDSGIPAPPLDEAVLGPARTLVAEEPPDDLDLTPIDADRPPVDRGAAMLILLLGTAVIVLFCVAQASLFLTTLAAWPPVVRWVGYGVAGLLAAMFAVSAVGLAWRYARLPVSPRVRVDRPDSLSTRRSVQLQARRNTALAKRQLREFLDRYPVDDRHRRHLASIAGADLADRLLSRRAQLLEHDPATDADWVRDLDDRFLAPLDEVAATLVMRHAVSVGWKTAIVPTGFLDGLIVVANAYHLIGGLCRLYHLRADAWSTLRITAHVFANTFVAGRLEDLTDTAADATFDQMHDLIHGQLARTVLSRVSSGLTQGTINALLLRRFGRHAIRSLRPIRR